MIDAPLTLGDRANKRLRAVDDLTDMGRPDSVVVGSAWGHISNSEWTEREVLRRRRKEDLVFVRRNGGGRICINKPRNGLVTALSI